MPWVIMLNTWGRTPHRSLDQCATVSSPVPYPANSGHLSLSRLLALSPQLDLLHSAWVFISLCCRLEILIKAASLGNCRAYLVCFPFSQELSFIAWNGLITIVSYILCGFLWSFWLFVSGKRVNLVPVAPSWLDAKVLLWLKFFLTVLKLKQCGTHGWFIHWSLPVLKHLCK